MMRQIKKLFLGLILVLGLSIFPVGSAKAQQAFFYLSSPVENFEPGEIFAVDVLISSEETAVNAAQAVIYFPIELLEVVEILKTDSIFSLWIQEPTYSNFRGEIFFGGGLPSPGFKGRAGKVMTIFFRAKSIGIAEISFGKESILANNPQGTNIFSSSQSSRYSIGNLEVLPPKNNNRPPSAPEIISPTHPFADKWSNNNNPVFHWSLTADITGISSAFNQKPVFDPGNISRGLFNSKTFKKVDDGIWYFHLKFKNDAGWGKISHFKIQIDTQPPDPFEITIDDGGDPTNPFPLLYFETKDNLSGISHYEVKIEEGDTFNLVKLHTNPFRAPYQAPGSHLVVVKAVDMAGNKRTTSAELRVESLPAPKITVCPDTFVSGEEILFVSGKSLPNAKVIVFLERGQELLEKWEVLSDEEGSWLLKKAKIFKPGVYRISARVQDEKGAISHPSEECLFRIILKGMVLGPWIVTYELMTYLLIIIFVLGLIGFGCFLRKIRKARRLRKREIEDLKTKFYKEFNELRRDIERQIELFRKTRDSEMLTPLEEKREKQLLKNLADVERVLREELKDVEEIE